MPLVAVKMRPTHHPWWKAVDDEVVPREGYQGEAGLMPARGGNPSLTDEQVASTVHWMLDNLK
jgi:cytochrome c5